MKQLSRVAVLCAALVGALAVVAAELPRVTPESQGVSSRAIAAWLDAVGALKGNDTLHSFVLVRHGKVIAEGAWAPYRTDRIHILNSLSKSFTSTAVGFAVEEGRLALDDRVADIFADKLPTNPSPRLLSLRVRDLLTMRCGIETVEMIGMRATNDGDWVKAFLAQPFANDPGTHFCYNTGATFLLSAIVQKKTGEDILAYLTPRLFKPLGITDAVWSANAHGICVGGYGLRLSSRDISRFGQFLLNRGTWEGKRLMSSEWIDLATARQTFTRFPPARSDDWACGYGFQFWRCRPADVYRGDGAFGQYCIVMPRQDAVLAITSDVGDMGAVLAAIWDTLLPAFKDAPAAPDPEGDDDLAARIATLALKLPAGAATPAASPLMGTTYSVATNAVGLKSVALNAAPGGGWTLALENGFGRQTLAIGSGHWGAEGRLCLSPYKYDSLAQEIGLQPAVAAGVWTAPDTFRVSILFVESPTRLELDFRLDGGRLLLDATFTRKFGASVFHFTGR